MSLPLDLKALQEWAFHHETAGEGVSPPDRGNQKHVRARSVNFEVLAILFLQYGGGKGPEGFPVLDLEIHDALGILRPGSPRMLLAPKALGPNSMRPAMYPTIFPRQSAPQRLAPLPGIKLTIRIALLVKEGLDCLIGKGRSEV